MGEDSGVLVRAGLLVEDDGAATTASGEESWEECIDVCNGSGGDDVVLCVMVFGPGSVERDIGDVRLCGNLRYGGDFFASGIKAVAVSVWIVLCDRQERESTACPDIKEHLCAVYCGFDMTGTDDEVYRK